MFRVPCRAMCSKAKAVLDGTSKKYLPLNAKSPVVLWIPNVFSKRLMNATKNWIHRSVPVNAPWKDFPANNTQFGCPSALNADLLGCPLLKNRKFQSLKM